MISDHVIGSLPVWDLSDLYDSVDDSKIERDLGLLDSAVSQFVKVKGIVASLSEEELIRAIRDFEAISALAHKLSAFANLGKSVDRLDARKSAFHQKIVEKVTDIHKDCQFFSLELNDIEGIERYYAGSLAPYKVWLQRVRRFRDHQLSLEMENLLSDKNLTGNEAWIRLFDETHASISYDFRGESVPFAQVAHSLVDDDESVRRDAAKAIAHTLQNNSRVFSLVTNNIAKDKSIDDGLRRFDRPISSRNMANDIDDKVVDTLVNTVKSNYASVSHRYYRLKAKLLGKDKLNYWDRNAPLFCGASQKKYSWDEAKRKVLKAYSGFSEDMAHKAEQLFKMQKIDAPISQTKDSGAFCYACAPNKIPYVMVNFTGTLNDVYTLAHELGHAVHYMMVDRPFLLYHPPLTFAETASVFGEQLLFRDLLAQEENRESRASMLAESINGAINTIFRQVAFCDFESIVHDRRASGEVSAEEIGKIWMQTQSEVLGDGVKLEREYECYWSMVPHFIHAPFYVYAYAFGACLVNALYGMYKNEGESFVPKYEKLLSMGGDVSLEALRKDFGFDLRKPEFWQLGIDVVSDMLTELESLV